MGKLVKPICQYCGGQIVVEFIGSYGQIYKLKKDGTLSQRHKNILYETDGNEPMIYCRDCGRAVDKE